MLEVSQQQSLPVLLGDLLQPALQHEELRGVALLRLGRLLLEVGSEALHLQPVTLLQPELLLLSVLLQPLELHGDAGGGGARLRLQI